MESIFNSEILVQGRNGNEKVMCHRMTWGPHFAKLKFQTKSNTGFVVIQLGSKFPENFFLLIVQFAVFSYIFVTICLNLIPQMFI